jgi:hypothetical protein
VPVQRPHHAKTRQHAVAAVFGDQRHLASFARHMDGAACSRFGNEGSGLAQDAQARWHLVAC